MPIKLTSNENCFISENRRTCQWSWIPRIIAFYLWIDRHWRWLPSYTALYLCRDGHANKVYLTRIPLFTFIEKDTIDEVEFYKSFFLSLQRLTCVWSWLPQRIILCLFEREFIIQLTFIEYSFFYLWINGHENEVGFHRVLLLYNIF